jgi:hypothetical protein
MLARAADLAALLGEVLFEHLLVLLRREVGRQLLQPLRRSERGDEPSPAPR